MGSRDRSRSPAGFNMEEVNDLIINRQRARVGRDFENADKIRDQLSALGITLQDKTASWHHAGGFSGRIPTFAEIETGNLPGAAQEGMYPETAQEDPANFAGGDHEVHIRSLIRQREQARAHKNFTESDRIRDELLGIGVEMQDKEKLWKTANGLSGCILGYGKGGVTDTEVNTLVVQREKARAGNEYEKADKIRDELKREGVDIFDKEKTWRIKDGRTGPVPSWEQIMGNVGMAPAGGMMHHGGSMGVGGGMMHHGGPMGMSRPPPPPTGKGGHSKDLQAQVVEAALACSQNPVDAQRTLQMLRQMLAANAISTHNHAIPPHHGGARPPMMKGGHGGAPPPPPMMKQASNPQAQELLVFIQNCINSKYNPTDVDIQWLVDTREKLRMAKDFPSADEVRNTMRTGLGIEIREKERCWGTSDGRSGMIPSFDQLR